MVTLAVSRLPIAPLTAERGRIYPDTVRRGEMLRKCCSPGTLVTEDVHWITAVTAGRVVIIHLLARANVEVATMLME